jgi:hypothetical protein
VSPWPRDRITLWLSPHALIATRRRRGLRARGGVQLRQSQLMSVASLRDWSDCAQAMEAELADSGWTNADVSVALSDHFVRYACLEWREGLRNRADWEAYAAFEMERRYGTTSGDALCIAPAGLGTARLAAAVDQGLLERLTEAVRRIKGRLRRIEPNACRVANRFRQRMGRRAELVIAEPQRLTWLSMANDCWTDVKSVRSRGSEALSILLLEARVRANPEEAPDQVLAWGPVGDAASIGHLAGDWHALQIPANTPAPCAALGMI